MSGIAAKATASNLLYQAAGQWEAMPTWASFFRSVGWVCAANRSGSERLIVGALVPTRSFAAGFVALGAVEARLAASPEQATADEHFLALCELPSGADVTVQMAGKKYQARFVGREIRNGKSGISVRFVKDGVQNFLPADVCYRVTTGRLGKDLLAKRPRIVDTARRSWDATFVEKALGIEDANLFARHDDFAALIIGKLSILRYELEEAAFGIRSRTQTFSGHIEDLIRTKKFADDPAGETFRTEVLSDRARDLDRDIAVLNPPVVVFDGARAFEKHHRSWLKASWVVILDQSDEATSDGADILNGLYAKRSSDSDPLSAIEVPPAVEVMSFIARAS